MFKIRRKKGSLLGLFLHRKKIPDELFPPMHRDVARGILSTLRFLPVFHRDLAQCPPKLSAEQLIIFEPWLRLQVTPSFPDLVAHAETHHLITHQEGQDLLSGKSIEFNTTPPP